MSKVWNEISESFEELYLQEISRFVGTMKLTSALKLKESPTTLSLKMDRLTRSEEKLRKVLLESDFWPEFIKFQKKRAKSLFDIFTLIANDVKGEIFKGLSQDQEDKLLEAAINVFQKESFMNIFVKKQFLEVPFNAKSDALCDYHNKLLNGNIDIMAPTATKNMRNYFYAADKIVDSCREIKKLRKLYETIIQGIKSSGLASSDFENLIHSFFEGTFREERIKQKLTDNLDYKLLERITIGNKDSVETFFNNEVSTGLIKKEELIFVMQNLVKKSRSVESVEYIIPQKKINEVVRFIFENLSIEKWLRYEGEISKFDYDVFSDVVSEKEVFEKVYAHQQIYQNTQSKYTTSDSLFVQIYKREKAVKYFWERKASRYIVFAREKDSALLLNKFYEGEDIFDLEERKVLSVSILENVFYQILNCNEYLQIEDLKTLMSQYSSKGSLQYSTISEVNAKDNRLQFVVDSPDIENISKEEFLRVLVGTTKKSLDTIKNNNDIGTDPNYKTNLFNELHSISLAKRLKETKKNKEEISVSRKKI